jgi:hypothetical protein
VVDWNPVYNESNTDTKCTTFHELLIKFIDKILPITETILKTKDINKPYTDDITFGLVEQIKLFDEMLVQYPANLHYKEMLSYIKQKLNNYLKFRLCLDNTKKNQRVK